MEGKKKAAPITRTGNGHEIITSPEYKGSVFLLPFHQRRVLNLLSDGVPRSAADISIELHMSDPRSTIRELRAKGVLIADVWCNSCHGGRFKRYFIRKEAGNE